MKARQYNKLLVIILLLAASITLPLQAKPTEAFFAAAISIESGPTVRIPGITTATVLRLSGYNDTFSVRWKRNGGDAGSGPTCAATREGTYVAQVNLSTNPNNPFWPTVATFVVQALSHSITVNGPAKLDPNAGTRLCLSSNATDYITERRWFRNDVDENRSTAATCRPAVVPGQYTVQVTYRFGTQRSTLTVRAVTLQPAAQAPSVRVSRTTCDPVSPPPVFTVRNFSTFSKVTWYRNGQLLRPMTTDTFTVSSPGRYLAKAVWSGETVYSHEIDIAKGSIPQPYISSGNGSFELTYQEPQIRLSVNQNYKAGITWYLNDQVMPGMTLSYIDISRPGNYKVTACATHPDGETECKTSVQRTVTGETLKVNYVRQHVPRVEGIRSTQQLEGQPKEQVQVASTYADGFARSLQTVQQAASPLGKDAVAFSSYDAFGREAKKYLPFVSKQADGKYHHLNAQNPAAITEFYRGSDELIASTQYPFSEAVYEPSPLNRVSEQSAPGEDWRLTAGHTTKLQDATNQAADNVRIWKKSATGLASSASYAPGMLFTKKTTDEHSQVAYTFTDKNDQLVLADNPGANGERLRTYYVYNDLGKLTDVIPPKLVKALGNAATLTIDNATLHRECYHYQYDERGRQIVKYLPGADSVLFVYDAWDRAVLAQDGNQRAKGKWSFTKYDATDRVVMKGEITKAGNQASLTQVVKNFYALVGQNPALRYEERGNALHGYSNRSYPVLSRELEVNTVNYYDAYDFPSPHPFVAEPSLGLTAAFNRVQGLVTGVKNRVLGTSQYLTTVSYYDKRYRMVQAIAANHLGGIDRSSSRYDFTGKVTKDRHLHQGKETVSLTKEYIYDHQDRLLKVYHQVNSEPKALIADLHYNELGELTEKNLHVESSGKPWQSLDYRYNIRGWLSTLNNATTEPGALYNDLYAFKLYYNDRSTELHNVRQFNGNVSAFKEQRPFEVEASGTAVRYGYAYTYDPADQLKQATYYQPSDPTRNGAYNEGQTYDLNGNITTLQRKGPVEGITQTIDELEYQYEGNQLTVVKDRGNAKEGFKDGNQTRDYTYDANGNLISDANKRIASIHYNLLNLPDTIAFSDGRAIVYTYDVAGKKLRQQVRAANGSVKQKRDYVGNFVYRNDTLQEIQHAEGRIVRQSPGVPSSRWEYQYHLKDHLGNVKATLTTVPQQDVFRAGLEDVATTIEAAQLNPTYQQALRYTSALYNHTPGGVKSLRLSAASEREIIGLAKSLKVMPGDTVRMEVYAKYFSPTSQRTNVPGLMLAAMSSAFGLPVGAMGETGMAYQSLTALNGAGLLIHSGQGTSDNAPKAYLNYLLFDQDFVPYDLGFDQVSTQALETGNNTPHEKLVLQSIVKRPGYLYVYLSNENATITDVFFDDLQITHVHSPLVATTDYYPFGMIAQQYSREGSVDQRLKYNSKEFQSEEGLDWYDYGARMYDATLGRWHVVDPMAEKYNDWSPYNYVVNNPLKFVDPDGKGVEHFYRMLWFRDKIIEKGVAVENAVLQNCVVNAVADNFEISVNVGLSASAEAKIGEHIKVGGSVAAIEASVTVSPNGIKANVTVASAEAEATVAGYGGAVEGRLAEIKADSEGHVETEVLGGSASIKARHSEVKGKKEVTYEKVQEEGKKKDGVTLGLTIGVGVKARVNPTGAVTDLYKKCFSQPLIKTDFLFDNIQKWY